MRKKSVQFALDKKENLLRLGAVNVIFIILKVQKTFDAIN
jgi:hypothetical protein